MTTRRVAHLCLLGAMAILALAVLIQECAVRQAPPPAPATAVPPVVVLPVASPSPTALVVPTRSPVPEPIISTPRPMATATPSPTVEPTPSPTNTPSRPMIQRGP